MQTQAHKDVVKNITTASQLEGELQLSQAQHGVAVLDIYNAEWGHCKALSETFRRLHTDAGDLVHLRFFSVECNAVLDSLHSPDDAKAPLRPKGMEFSQETLAAFWTKMLEQRQNHSKPYFAFYKEGKMRTHLEGIDTPKICRIVHDLCKQQNAAAEYITNPDVLHFWESNFSPSENEVPTNEFVHAARALVGSTATELNGDDVAHITAAVHSGNGSGDTVSAAALQSFVGDSGTLKDALLAVVAERRSAAAAQAPQPPPPSPPSTLHAAEKVEAAPPAQETREPAEIDEYPHEDAAHGAAARELPSHSSAASPPPGSDGADGAAESAAEVEPQHATEEEEGEDDNGVEELGESGAADGAVGEAEGEKYEELDEPGENAAAAADDERYEELDEPKEAAAADQYEELDEPDDDHHTAEASYPQEDAEAEASAIAASSAAPPSVPEGTSAERNRELDVATTEATSPTPSPSPPHAAAEDAAVAPFSESPPPPAGAGASHGSANATPEQDDSTINQIFTNRWVTVSEEEMHVWNTVAALPLHYPQSTTLMADLANDEVMARGALPDSPETFPTLAEHLAAQGVPFADVNMMCIAADQKVGSESLSYGKLSLILMSCDSEVSKGLVPECELFLDELSAGTLLRQHQPLAFTALALSASEAYPDECFYYSLPDGTAAPFQSLNVNDVFVLNALTPLNTAAPASGVFALRIIGLPKVIELATTDESDDTMVLSQWYARLRVAEVGADAVTVHFVENVCDEEFQGFLAGYIPRLIEDENKLDKKQGETPADGAEEGGDEAAYEIGDEEEGEYEEDAAAAEEEEAVEL